MQSEPTGDSDFAQPGSQRLLGRSLHEPLFNRCPDDIHLALHDWRDVDAAVRGIGLWMKCRNVGGDVVLRVEAVPPPHKLL